MHEKLIGAMKLMLSMATTLESLLSKAAKVETLPHDENSVTASPGVSTHHKNVVTDVQRAAYPWRVRRENHCRDLQPRQRTVQNWCGRPGECEAAKPTKATEAWTEVKDTSKETRKVAKWKLAEQIRRENAVRWEQEAKRDQERVRAAIAIQKLFRGFSCRARFNAVATSEAAVADIATATADERLSGPTQRKAKHTKQAKKDSAKKGAARKDRENKTKARDEESALNEAFATAEAEREETKRRFAAQLASLRKREVLCCPRRHKMAPLIANAGDECMACGKLVENRPTFVCEGRGCGFKVCPQCQPGSDAESHGLPPGTFQS